MVVKSRCEQLEDYANKSSMHALPIAILFDGLALKIFWTLVWIIGTIAATVHIYLQYQHFKTYPHDVNIMFVTTDILPFPAVTFCNMSPLKKSGLFCDTEDLQSLVELETIGEDTMCEANLGDKAVFPLGRFWKCGLRNETNGTQSSDITFLPVQFCDNGEITMKPYSMNEPDSYDYDLYDDTVGTSEILLDPTAAGGFSDATSAGLQSQTTVMNKLSLQTDTPNTDQSMESSPTTDEVSISPTIDDDVAQTEGLLATESMTSDQPHYPDTPEPDQEFIDSTQSTPGLHNFDDIDLFGDNYDDYSGFNEDGDLPDGEVYGQGPLINQVYLTFLKFAETDDLSDMQKRIRFSSDILQKHGFTLEDMLVSCSFNGFNCSETFFTTTADSKHGLCHTFRGRPMNNSHKTISTKKHGFQSGLKLILNIHSDEYLGLLANDYGIRVAVHSPELEAPLDRTSINVATGKKTAIAVSMVEIERLEAPYKSNCTQSYPDHYTPHTFGTGEYTEDSCRAACTRYYLAKYCNCTELQRTEPDSVVTAYVCQWENPNEAQTGCRMYVSEHLSQNRSDPNALICDCPNACHERTYHISSSSTVWPTTAYRHLLSRNFVSLQNNGLKQFLASVKTYENQFATRFNQFYGLEWEPPKVKDIVANNLVNLNVYYQQLSYERIEENESYKFTSFLADIGGILGLYIGMSIISFVEIFEAIYLAFHYMCCAKQKRQPNNNTFFLSNKTHPMSNKNYMDDDVSDTVPHPRAT